MRLIIAGGSTYRLLPTDVQRLDTIRTQYQIDFVVTGGARGADMDGIRWAQSAGIPYCGFPADWETYGRAAGPKRNQEMAAFVTAAGALAAFPGGRATANMLQTALAMGLRVFDWREGSACLE